MNPGDIISGLAAGAAVTAGVELLNSCVKQYSQKLLRQQKPAEKSSARARSRK